MRVLKAIAFTYQIKQDRILTVVNPAQADTWSCWLTRRLVLDVIRRAPPFIEGSSPLAQQSPADFREEIIAFEREAALASTAPSLTRTNDALIRKSAETTELADRITISQHGDKFRLELHGDAGAEAAAAAMLARAEFQRVLQMLEREVLRAGWLSMPTTEPISPAPTPGPNKPVRQLVGNRSQWHEEVVDVSFGLRRQAAALLRISICCKRAIRF